MKRVYYLDDEAELCSVFKEFISSDFIEVKTFTDCQDAVLACENERPDIFFIDYRLKNSTGNLVAKMVDESIDKILVTGELDLPDYKEFSQVISKPFSLIELSELIEKKLK